MISIQQIATTVSGTFLQQPAPGASIEALSTDSRKASSSAGTLFIAIRGARHDGHDYLQALYRAGVRNFIVERAVEASLPEANIIRVANAVSALQAIAAYQRSLYSIPVIGITGSNGKTIIKEWLYQMLSPDKIIVKNPGSYNSQVGVPLSVWMLRPYHQLAIFEAGISKAGEMTRLEHIIRPTIGIFSTIGTAHDEGFSSRAEKIAEKLKLFDRAEVIIYCRDHSEIHEQIDQKNRRTFTWGHGNDADIQVSDAPDAVRIRYSGQECALATSALDRASVENTLHCLATMVWMGYDLATIVKRAAGLRTIPMRLELKEGINRCQVIDDTYNNDLGSLEIALQFLASQQQRNKRRVILSDILESGLADDQLAHAVASLVKNSNIQSVVCIGTVLKKYGSLFPQGTQFFSDTESFLETFDLAAVDNEVILVKGARKFAFERIVARLQRKVHGTVAEVNMSALIHNLNYFRSRLKPSTKIMVMVKAFAYGSGSVEIANLLQYHQVDYLGVAYVDEGIDLRKNNITLPIMVMNPSEETFEALLKHGLEPEVYSMRILNALISFLDGATCRIHVKIDTGMHRLGFEPGELVALTDLLGANRNVTVASIFSHLAGADESAHDTFSQHQATVFQQAAEAIEKALGYTSVKHILNTSGILRLPQFQFDMARLGIGLYGVDPTPDAHPLQTVVTLKTIVSQIKHIRRGETVGYGRKGVADRDVTTATIALGYADGYSRAFSRGVGHVLVNGHEAAVFGNVCMDMTMIDVTGLPVEEGDEVIIYGKTLPVQRLADSINSIPYEILTSTSERVRRIFVADGI